MQDDGPIKGQTRPLYTRQLAMTTTRLVISIKGCQSNTKKSQMKLNNHDAENRQFMINQIHKINSQYSLKMPIQYQKPANNRITHM